MIEPGLAEDRLQTKAQFVRHNQQLVQSIESLAAKTRRRDLVIDPFQIARFYQERLPAEVFDKGRLEKYDRESPRPEWDRVDEDRGGCVRLSRQPDATRSRPRNALHGPDDLVEMDSVVISQEAFPDELTVGGSKLPLEYRFEPGGERDGVNIKVHAAAITQISDGRLGWLVPGLLPTKITSMIKSLPKRIRRNLVPAADVAAKIAEELQEDYGKVPFETAICAAISRHAEMPVTIDDFQEEKMDGHLRMLVSVVDDDGNTIAEGRNVAPLIRKAAAAGDQNPLQVDDTNETDDEWKRDDMKTFDIQRLPAEVVRVRGGVEVAQFPGLVIDGGRVGTSIFPDRGSAERSLAAGATALYAVKTRKELRSQIRHLPALADAKLKIGGWLGGNVEDSLERLLARIAFVEREKPLRSTAEYQRRLDDKNRRIYEGTVKIAGWLSQLTEHGFAARKEIESFKSGKNAPVVADVTRQKRNLIFEGWLDQVPWQWIEEYPRYLRGIAYRLDKLRHGSASRDDESMRTVHQLQDGYLAGKAIESPESPSPSDLAEDEVRWMIEELRVSLFAQPLGTSVKVSPKRIEKMLGSK